MGDPRKLRNKYSTPMHPWQKVRIDTEKPLMKIYGLSNKKELWRVESKLKKYKDNAKKLVVRTGSQADIERKQLIEKLKSYNLLQTNSMDEILGLNLQQLLDRRLQTLLSKTGLARSIKQARQMITHGHVSVGGKKVTSPGYLVRVEEEATISFTDSSNFKNQEHPERKIPEKVPVEKSKDVKKNESKKEEEAKAPKEEVPKVENKEEAKTQEPVSEKQSTEKEAKKE